MSGKYKRKDFLYNKAKDEGYRSRAAYKLLEIDSRFKLFKGSRKVLDIGSAPGGWSQVAIRLLKEDAIVVGVDIEAQKPFTKAEAGDSPAKFAFIHGSITDKEIQDKLVSHVQGAVDVILSDMSPKLTGIKDRDQAESLRLVETAFTIAQSHLCAGGSFVAKLFPSPETDEFVSLLKQSFKRLHRVHADASRKTSKEFYLVGVGFNKRKEE